MKSILGTKIGMIKLFDVDGHAFSGTIIHCEPNVILENKKSIDDNHSDVKVGYYSIKENKNNKPYNGIFKKLQQEPMRYIRTFSNNECTGKVGDKITVADFVVGTYVDVQGTSKGHGFTGAIKRWNFKIGPLAHGAGYPHRFQGSIAMGRGGSQAQRVAKGKKMHGHYGVDTSTVQNLIVLYISTKDNIIIVSGGIPGPKKSLVKISTSYKKPQKNINIDLISKANKEELLKANEVLENKDELHAANVEVEKEEEKLKEAEEQAKKQEQEQRDKEKEAADKEVKKEGGQK